MPDIDEPQLYLVKVTCISLGARRVIQGSAVFIAPKLLLTCRHVVWYGWGKEHADRSWATEIQVGWGVNGSERQTPAKIFQSDAQRALRGMDLAVLEVDSPPEDAEIPGWMNPKEIARDGKEVYALGYPRGVFEKWLTVVDGGPNSESIQTRGPVAEGTSGGVLECDYHPDFYCIGLLSEDAKTAVRSIAYGTIVKYLRRLNLELPPTRTRAPRPAGPTVERPLPPRDRGDHRFRRHWIVPAVLVVGAVVVAAILFALWPGHKPNGPESPAKAGYVTIPPGQYMMGCSVGDLTCFADDELPRHSVSISRPFLLMRNEVTVGNFRAYALVTGAKPPGPNASEDLPMTNITWNDAKAYCEGDGGRLPTEAEWEYAARAGSVERFYDRPDEIAWYQANTDSAHNVGQKKQNTFELHDMLGNVSEWVNDRYDRNYYKSSPRSDPQGPINGDMRVVRGSSYKDDTDLLRVSRREAREPGSVSAQIGFRCAQDPRQPGR